MLQFEQCLPDDLDQIVALDAAAIAFQKTVSHLEWQPIDPEVIRREIAAGRYWKIVESGEIGFLFIVAFSDPAIWDERSDDKAIYLHRFVTNPAFRGRGYVKALTEWAKRYAVDHDLDFVRLDTWIDNAPLCDYYASIGYEPVGEKTLAPHPMLAPHYWEITVRLFEIKMLFNPEI